SLIKSLRLQKQFKYNYNHLAREFFYNLDKDIQDELLNIEFNFDKRLLLLSRHSNLPYHRSSHRQIPYLYTSTFENLGGHKGAQVHIRHNLYRTISALLLDDCTIEEKSIILNKSIPLKYRYSTEVVALCEHRLNSLIKHTNQQTLEL
ncbi:MAG: hypothetical protein IJ371_06095, partial [Clostridia bacterium]|nr:hypothetical protein [Clostridia bacterium]